MIEQATSSMAKSRPVLARKKIKLLYLIPSLQTGGAEVQLLSLVKSLNKESFEATVAVFYRKGELINRFESVPGLKVVFLDKKSNLDFSFLRRLKKLIRQENFDILQAFNV